MLDIGCGGGKSVFNLKETFSVTGVDLSPTMLTQARDLNRESTFVLGNIRTFQLGTTFDVVFVENVYDTDPADEQYGTTVLFLIRDHGRLRIETDHWTMGIFSPDTWRRVLRDTGFEVHEG